MNETGTSLALFPFAFISLWLGVGAIIAILGGWTALAASYPAPDGFRADPDRIFRFRSIQLRRNWWLPAHYNGVMAIGLAPEGLYLAPFVLFRFFHQPLLIPWPAISDCDGGSFLWTSWVDVTLQAGDPSLRIYGAPGDAAWGEWRVRARRHLPS